MECKGRGEESSTACKTMIAHKYPKRYQLIVSDFNANSDDEYNTKTGLYIIKKPPYQSENATAFFKRLDIKMAEVDRMMGHIPNQQVCRRPKKPIISDFEKTPKNIPIDFYQTEWFNEKNNSEKLLASELSEVAFVPVKTLPPDKRLGDLSFD
ncbi:hypothetical protein O181_030570 [Austropuccinia psidii MF-1]|uniref:Uncharacterized protein n=1 Tax=Austropuccinia psidii MF-1 TaxID=1389203 RepID=A0A9Q3H6C4_9BASI|nr:hypothetical protein [Austropuccinia psidii MF-1]